MLYHRNVNPRLAHLGRPLIVFAQTPASVQPGKGSLDDPTLGHHNEALGTRWPLDNLQQTQPAAVQPRHQSVADIDAVGVNRLHSGELPTDLVENQFGPVVVLHAGRGDDDRQHEAHRIHKHMPLAAGDLLPPVIAEGTTVELAQEKDAPPLPKEAAPSDRRDPVKNPVHEPPMETLATAGTDITVRLWDLAGNAARERVALRGGELMTSMGELCGVFT